MKRYVVCYDISIDSIRNRTLKELKNKGFHAQRSFFELKAGNAQEIEKSLEFVFSPANRFAIIRLNRRGKIKRIGSLLEGMEWVL